jgi:nitrite reductase/ring-hydroxylating ferredoxin subunit
LRILGGSVAVIAWMRFKYVEGRSGSSTSAGFTRPAFATTAGSRLGPWEIRYIPVAAVAELTAGALKEVDLGGRQVLLAFVDGKYFAFARQCPHADADLKMGTLQGTQIRCNNHNCCFDLQSGKCVLPQGGPTLTVLPTEKRGEEFCIRLEW